MEHIPPTWGMLTALCVLYLLKKEASATLGKKQSAVLLLLYRFFCNGKEGILKHYSQGHAFIMSLPEIPSIWVGVLYLQWALKNGRIFFPLYSICFSTLEKWNYLEHGNLGIVRSMILFTLTCTVIGLKGGSYSVCSLISSTACYGTTNKEWGKQLFEWVVLSAGICIIFLFTL